MTFTFSLGPLLEEVLEAKMFLNKRFVMQM